MRMTTGFDGQPTGNKNALKTIVKSFADACSRQVTRLFTQPDTAGDSAWVPNHLEYQFAVGAQPDDREAVPVLRADQYCQGRLDWYSFDRSRIVRCTFRRTPRCRRRQMSTTNRWNRSFPLRCGSKDNRSRASGRWRNRRRLRKIDTSATGLLHLLLAEFGLIYSNDWFMLPHPMPINTVCEVRGILVDDTFGRHTFIRAAGARDRRTAWQRFAMFHLTEHEQRPAAAGNLFYLAPAAGKVLEARRSSASISCGTKWPTLRGAGGDRAVADGIGDERLRGVALTRRGSRRARWSTRMCASRTWPEPRCPRTGFH